MLDGTHWLVVNNKGNGTLFFRVSNSLPPTIVALVLILKIKDYELKQHIRP